MAKLILFILMLPLVARAGCGVSSYDVLDYIQQDCQLNAILSGESHREKEHCASLNAGIAAASAVAAGIGYKAGAELPDRFKHYLIHNKTRVAYGQAIGKALKKAGIHGAESMIFQELFRSHPGADHLSPAKKRELLNRSIQRALGQFGDDYTHFSQNRLNAMVEKIDDVAKYLRAEPGAGPIGRVAYIAGNWAWGKKPGAVAFSSNVLKVSDKLKLVAKVGGAALGAFTAFGILNEFTRPLDCDEERKRMTIWAPMDSRCRPDFDIPEYQKDEIVNTMGRGTPNAFQAKLNSNKNLCQVYTRIVAHRRALEGKPAVDLRKLDFSCQGARAASISFEERPGRVDIGCAGGARANFRGVRLGDGNIALAQNCRSLIPFRFVPGPAERRLFASL